MVPVIVLTGFLGSGKTSLLNRLLDTRPSGGGKIAVIVNELGAVGIDADLLPADMSRQIELPGGCICCVLNEDLERTLCELVDSEPSLSTILIETTGIAEPLPISWTLAGEALAQRVRLAAVVTVVDAEEHLRHQQLTPTVDAQVEHADILVVSKLDLTGGQLLPDLRAQLRSLNELAPIITEERSVLAPALWRALTDPSLELADRGTARDHLHAHTEFHSVVLPIEDTLDFEELTARLEELPPSYVRIKGIARAIDASTGSTEPRLIVFHRVGARVSSEVLNERTLATRIVAIGPDVDADRLATCLRAAVVR